VKPSETTVFVILSPVRLPFRHAGIFSLPTRFTTISPIRQSRPENPQPICRSQVTFDYQELSAARKQPIRIARNVSSFWLWRARQVCFTLSRS
jgi:hypothetical protein